MKETSLPICSLSQRKQNQGYKHNCNYHYSLGQNLSWIRNLGHQKEIEQSCLIGDTFSQFFIVKCLTLFRIIIYISILTGYWFIYTEMTTDMH